MAIFNRLYMAEMGVGTVTVKHLYSHNKKQAQQFESDYRQQGLEPIPVTL